MATIIPNLSTIRRMSRGERRLGQRLETLLEDDYTVWYDTPVGRNRRYPDYIVLHPGRGLLFLEVKDWKLDTLKSLNPRDAEILTPGGLKTVSNPLQQARNNSKANSASRGAMGWCSPISPASNGTRPLVKSIRNWCYRHTG